jgi:signal transduction histidine kinase
VTSEGERANGHRAAEELRRRTQGLATLLEVSRSLAATLDLQAVLQATTDGATHLFGLQTAAVYLLGGQTLRLSATTPPLPPHFPEELRNAPLADHPHIRQAITSGQPVLVRDIVADDLTPAERSVTEQRGLRSVLFIPLIAAVESLGTLIVGSVGRPREITEAEIDLSRTLANLAALAVENARLYEAGQQYAAELERTLADRDRSEKERLELERRLLHAQKLESLGILAGGIAHDFNNLLMAIQGNLDLALGNLSPVAPARVNIEQSVQAARRATDLTRQMLAYSGKGKFLVRAMDLSELVEENAHLLRASIARTVSLDLHLEPALPPIEADAGQLQQVVMNLITNASEAIGDSPGKITVTTGVQECDGECLKHNRTEAVPPAGRFVFLEVSDTGCGMGELTRQRLFDPFFSTKATGRGLGMSALLGIVRGHRGALFVDSDVGRGSTVRVLFPASARATSARDAAPVAHSPTPEASLLRGTVLVADDEEVVRDVSKSMLQSFGMQVLVASDGREAVEIFREHADTISLVILDLSMPNLDGIAAFREMTRIRPHVRVILSSGYDEQDSIQDAGNQGLAGFIQKPYSLAKLREILRQTVTR